MRLRVEHTTIFTYDEPITEGYTELRLRPLRGGRASAACPSASAPIRRAEVHSYVDRYGNDVRHFDILAPHERLVVTARSEVSTADGRSRDGARA